MHIISYILKVTYHNQKAAIIILAQHKNIYYSLMGYVKD